MFSSSRNNVARFWIRDFGRFFISTLTPRRIAYSRVFACIRVDVCASRSAVTKRPARRKRYEILDVVCAFSWRRRKNSFERYRRGAGKYWSTSLRPGNVSCIDFSDAKALAREAAVFLGKVKGCRGGVSTGESCSIGGGRSTTCRPSSPPRTRAYVHTLLHFRGTR